MKDLRPVFHFLKRYKSRYIVITAFALLNGFLESLNIAIILPILYLLLGQGAGIGDHGYLIKWVDRGLALIPWDDKLMAASVFLLVAFAVKSVTRVFAEFLNADASGKVQYELSKDVLDKYTRAAYPYFLSEKQGGMTYSLIMATTSVSRLLYRMCHLLAESFKVAGIIVLLLTINLAISIFLFIYALIFIWFMSFISKKICYKLADERTQRSIHLRNIALELFLGIKQVRVYNAISRWVDSFNTNRKRTSDLFARELVWRGIPSEFMEMTTIFLIISIILVLRFNGSYGFMDVMPVLTIFTISILKIFPAIKGIGVNLMELRGTLPDVNIVYDVLHADIQEKLTGQKQDIRFEHAIQFKDVTFSYNGDKRILEHVDLLIEKGKTTALVGVSGSGKTTIINLLLRLYEPNQGRILIDDVALNDYERSAWFGMLGFVSQDSFIFHSTITENITFGDPRYTTADVEAAAKLANAHHFIAELPEGYQTVVGERGMKLSGGQQQRIAIARAMIRKPEILLLDEATSALDSLSEREIQDSLKKISRICTLIIVAHRLSTIRTANRIYVLKEGKVSEAGRHDELMAQKGYYAALHDHAT